MTGDPKIRPWVLHNGDGDGYHSAMVGMEITVDLVNCPTR